MSFYAQNDTFLKYGTLLMVLLYLTISHFGRRTFQKQTSKQTKSANLKRL